MMKMTARAGAPFPTLNDAVERMLRRSLLMLVRDDSIAQDQFDFADLADAVDARNLAGLVRNSARLRQGFTSESTQVTTPQGSIERAVAELRALIDDEGAPIAVIPAEAGDAAETCATFCALLEAPLDAATEAALAGQLAAWQGLAEAPPTDLRARVDAALPALIDAFATRALQAFLRRNFDLAFAPFGSARRLHGAARLCSGGLGPYLSGVGNIVRSGADVLGLIALAAGDRAATMIESWIVPLSAHLPDAVALALIEEVADLGMIDAVRSLLATAVRNDRPVPLRHLRDAALDLGDTILALSAQRTVIALSPLDPIERRHMGDMLATAGDTEGAEAAYAYAFRLLPGDANIEVRLAALRGGDFEAFAVSGGFATSLPRRQFRFARRAA